MEIRTNFAAAVLWGTYSFGVEQIKAPGSGYGQTPEYETHLEGECGPPLRGLIPGQFRDLT